jgi:3-oxoacyl-[acyl-carrier-protein] synthase II
MKRRVVITGIGVLNACGIGKDALWEAAQGGRTGLKVHHDDWIGAAPSKVFGIVPDFQPQTFVANRKSLKVMCRDIQMAVAASYLAKTDAGLTEGDYDPKRSGACIGAGVFNHDPEELADSFRAAMNEDASFNSKKFGSDGMGRLFPLWLLKYLPNMPACHITISHNLQGPSNTITADSSGSASSVEESIRIIERDRAAIMFCGGAECRQWDGVLQYYSEGILKNGGHSDARYPLFSADDGGIILGEGGAILILEEYEHAKKRGAKIYAEIAGFGVSSDAGSNDVSRQTQGQVYAMQKALDYGGLSLNDVDALHLSSRGVLCEDEIESQAVREVFGRVTHKPELVVTKALSGYLGYAAVPTEMGLAAMGIRNGCAAPSLVTGDGLLTDQFKFSGSEMRGAQVVMLNHFEKGLSRHSFVLTEVEEA